MKFVKQAFGQIPIPRDTINYELNCCFLVAKDIDQSSRFDIRAGVRDEIFQKAICDECFRRPAIQIIQPLKNTSLDA